MGFPWLLRLFFWLRSVGSSCLFIGFLWLLYRSFWVPPLVLLLFHGVPMVHFFLFLPWGLSGRLCDLWCHEAPAQHTRDAQAHLVQLVGRAAVAHAEVDPGGLAGAAGNEKGFCRTRLRDRGIESEGIERQRD